MTEPDALKAYLNEHLAKLCQGADSGALTKYIMALLKKNKRQSELRPFLIEQLEVFLSNHTKTFVDALLQAHMPDLDKKADTSGTPSSKMVPDVLEKSNHCNLDKTANSDVASETKHERSRKTPSKRIRRNDSPTTISEACSVSPSMSKRDEDNNIVERDPPPTTKPFDICMKPRCLDYNERGYCLKGSFCQFSHGCDAIPLNIDDVSSLNFNVTPEDLPPFEVNTDGSSLTSGTRSISPLPPLPPPPPPPPPLPPSMLDAALGVLEPYNPESPGMNSYYSSTPVSMGPTLPSSGPGICSNIYGARNETFHSKPLRTRELIGVPTVKSVSPRELNNEKTPELKRKATFDFSRLGPPKKLAKTDSTLELRKVPVHLNTIAMLNSHFSTFGRILNLEIAYDSDPEAALVKFSSPVEASNAYRSSVAIFNNRFIKVFYHNHRSNGANPLTVDKIERKEDMFDKLSPTQAKYAEISKGNVCVPRTVFIPHTNNRIFQKTPQQIPKKDRKKPFEKQLELLRKKQCLLKDSIDHEKVILAKLMKSKNKKEAEFLKKTIETISSKIGVLKSEIRNDSDGLKKKLTTVCEKKTAIEKSAHNINKSEKELLDAEMDLYKKRGGKNTQIRAHTETKETENLLSQVIELKEKAKSLGLIDGSVPPHGGLGAKHAKLKKHSIHGISCPKQILVCGPIKDKRDLLKHFEQFGNVENIEDKNPYNLVTFSSRAEAEAAFLNGSKFDGTTALNLVWFQAPQYSTIQNTDSAESKPTNPDIVGDDEEEEEDDEDSEARSWRR